MLVFSKLGIYEYRKTGTYDIDRFNFIIVIIIIMIRAVDKREYLVIISNNFSLFFIKAYVVTLHLNRLDETVHEVTTYCFNEK